MFTISLHEKFPALQPEKHQSTPQSLSWCTVGTAAKTQTHYCYYTPASFPPKTHTHSLSLLFCTFSTPLAVSAVREGREERGRGRGRDRRGGEGRREARPPCSHGRAECLHCRGSLCNTSGILRPLSPARDGGVVEERWEGAWVKRETFLAERKGEG